MYGRVRLVIPLELELLRLAAEIAAVPEHQLFIEDVVRLDDLDVTEGRAGVDAEHVELDGLGAVEDGVIVSRRA